MALISETVQNTAIKVIHSRITDVLLNVIYETANLRDEYADTELYGEVMATEEVSSAVKKAGELFKKLPENLAKEFEQRGGYSKEIADYRNELTDTYKTVFAYRTYTEILQKRSLMRSKLEISRSEFKDMPTPSPEDFAETVMSAISRSYDIPFALGSVISAIPLRMAKSKYEEYLKRSLEYLFTDISHDYINMMKQNFAVVLDPHAEKGYGKCFSLISQSLDELAVFDPETADVDGIEEYNDMLDDISNRLEETENVLNICYNIANYLDLLNNFAMDETYACYDDLVIKDLFYSCIEMLDSDEPAFYAESITDRTTDMIEQLFSESRNYEDALHDQLMNLSEAQKDRLPNDCKLAISVYKTISAQYLLEITDGLAGIGSADLAPVSIEEADKAANDIVDMVNAACAGKTPAEQKEIKQRLISKLPADMSPNEAREYLVYAIEGISDTEKRNVIYADLLELLDTLNLVQLDDEDGEDGHHHSHGCGCGHDHHDHDCDCGHDH